MRNYLKKVKSLENYDYNRKKKGLYVLSFLIILSTAPLNSFANSNELVWRASSGWGVRSQYGKLYSTKAIETIKGEILEIEEVRPYSGMRAGIHLLIKTDKDHAWVHLGPAWYILNQAMKFDVTDMIEVTGTRISSAEKHVVVAKEVVKNKMHLQLRDEAGIPFWCSTCLPKRGHFTEM